MKNKQRFLINCTTNWCGMDNSYPVIAESEDKLYEYADNLAIDNLMSYIDLDEIAEEQGYYADEMEEDEYEKIKDNIELSEYVNYNIELFDGTEEEWKELCEYQGVQEI